MQQPAARPNTSNNSSSSTTGRRHRGLRGLCFWSTLSIRISHSKTCYFVCSTTIPFGHHASGVAAYQEPQRSNGSRIQLCSGIRNSWKKCMKASPRGNFCFHTDNHHQVCYIWDLGSRIRRLQTGAPPLNTRAFTLGRFNASLAFFWCSVTRKLYMPSLLRAILRSSCLLAVRSEFVFSGVGFAAPLLRLCCFTGASLKVAFAGACMLCFVLLQLLIVIAGLAAYSTPHSLRHQWSVRAGCATEYSTAISTPQHLPLCVRLLLRRLRTDQQSVQ